MTLIEALKTGKRLRRRGWIQHTSPGYWVIIDDEQHRHINITRDDALATDWEVEPIPVPVTREQFDAAWQLARTKAPCTYDNLYQTLVKELGL